MEATTPPLLSVRDLWVRFPKAGGGLLGRRRVMLDAVAGVSFDLAAGSTLGVVGESGSGKSTLGRAVLGLVPRAAGDVLFAGTPLPIPVPRGMRRGMQMIFQDPAGSLNPRMRVVDAIAEPMLAHGLCPREASRGKALELLERCGLAASQGEKYPHELSGGQKQRAVIARALSLSPRLLVCDEPTSALDVSIQAHVLNLLADLQRDLGLAFLFISHDLSVVRHMADRIMVMRGGRVIESGLAASVLEEPREDYTKELLASVPRHPTRPAGV